MENADEAIFLWLNGLAGRQALLDWLAVKIASDYVVPAGLALALLGSWFMGGDAVLRQGRQIGVMAALASMGLSSLAVFIVNQVYVRPRPFVDLDATLLLYRPTDPSSFPSNAIAATFGIAAVTWSVDRRLGAAMLAATSLYALSRVFTGVHYPLDVLIGAAIGIAASMAVLKARDLLEPLLALAIKVARIFCLA